MKIINKVVKAVAITFFGVTVPTVGAIQVHSALFMTYIIIVWFICLVYIGLDCYDKQNG